MPLQSRREFKAVASSKLSRFQSRREQDARTNVSILDGIFIAYNQLIARSTIKYFKRT